METTAVEHACDGQAPFCPDIGCEIDATDQQRFQDFCLEQGWKSDALDEVRNVGSEEVDDDEENEDKDEESDEGDTGDGLSEKVIHKPPLFETDKGYYCPSFDKDNRFSMFCHSDDRMLSTT